MNFPFRIGNQVLNSDCHSCAHLRLFMRVLHLPGENCFGCTKYVRMDRSIFPAENKFELDPTKGLALYGIGPTND